MILLIIDFLRESFGIKTPAVFSYYSTRMILASLTALFFSIGFGPRFIKKLYELKIGQTIRMEECPLLGHLHEKKRDTPTMGGILILFSMIVSLLLWMDLRHSFTLILFLSTICLGFIGGYDDYLKLKYKNTKGLSARKKIVGQLLVSGLVALYLLSPTVSESIHHGRWFAPPQIKEQKELVEKSLELGQTATQTVENKLTLKEFASRLYLPFFKDPIIQFSGIAIFVMALLTVIVITGSSNAVNLTDGLDGLAAGCLMMVAATFALFSFVSNHIEIARYLNIVYIEGSGEIAIYLCAMVGACLGFLWYNGHPAQVFMGDIGSLALGGVIGISAVLLKREFLLAIVGGVFAVECLSVILQVLSYRYRNKRRIFLIAPLHHHFEYKGWAETKVVIRFWIVGLLLAIIGIASLKFQ